MLDEWENGMDGFVDDEFGLGVGDGGVAGTVDYWEKKGDDWASTSDDELALDKE